MPTRILIADDNAVFRGTLRQLLQAVDHWEVVEAHDGQEAISKAVELQPNLVILDLAMPVKDGLAAAREISQLLPEVPILMCTMHMSSHVEAEALKSGVRKVFSKSDSAFLIEAVRQLQPVPDSRAAADPLIDPIPPPPIPEALIAQPPVPTPPVEPVVDSPPQPKNVP